MTLTVHLDPEVERLLGEKALSRGLSLSAYLEHIAAEEAHADRDAQVLSIRRYLESAIDEDHAQFVDGELFMTQLLSELDEPESV